MKTLNKILIIVAIIIFIVASYFVVTNFIITGEVVVNEYYTKAICDENNFCQDFEIYCDGENLVEIIPVSGAVVQNLENWTDPRGELARELC